MEVYSLPSQKKKKKKKKNYKITYKFFCGEDLIESSMFSLIH